MMLNVAGYITLQWILLWPWARQQLNHFWIPKEPDELRDWPLKGFREGDNTVVLFTFLAYSMSDPIKCPTGGPKMGWVFKTRIAKSTLTWIFVDFYSMSSEPSMSCKELNEVTKGRTTKFHHRGPSTWSRKPLFCLEYQTYFKWFSFHFFEFSVLYENCKNTEIVTPSRF